MKRIFFAFVFLATCLLPIEAFAQAIISEIMYDMEGTDSGREWVEVKNIGQTPIKLVAWKLFEANTNHKINATGSDEVPVGGFAVIADDPAKFLVDNPGFFGTLFDSAFSLGNEGETLVLRDDSLTDIDSVSYSSAISAKGDGNSLQRTSAGAWIAARPSPGAETTAIASENPAQEAEGTRGETSAETENNDNSYSSHQSQSSVSSNYEEPELQVTLNRSRLGYVGVPLEFEAKLKKAKNVSLGNSITSVWSMGDGNQISGQFVSYAYEFPGEYIVIVNSDNGGVRAVSKSKVRIVEPKVAIKSADASHIEIANMDSSELNAGGFIVATKDRRFVIPTDTIISARSSIKIPASATKFRSLEGFVNIQTPRGRVLSEKSLEMNIVAAGHDAKPEDVVVALPPGMNEAMLREKIAVALESSVLPPSQQAVFQAPKQLEAQKPFAQTTALVATTMPAAVIYAVPELEDDGWWDRIKGIFGR